MTIDMNSNTTSNEPTGSIYDHTGAMVYIIIVLLWYSVGIIFMLGMQMRVRSEAIEESARRRTKLLIRNLREHTNTKEILEELVDKQKRARLWDIYLGTTSPPQEKLTRAETVRIRHIEKQLATINRNRRLTNETLFHIEDEVRYCRSRSDSRQVNTESITVEKQSLRRRSSFDQQTLERWKALANQSKTQEQMPWNIRKLMIRKYFRRHMKNPLSPIRQESTITNAPTDNLLTFTDQISTLTQHRSESNLHELNDDDSRQNPYLTYFYAGNSEPDILSTEFFPVRSEHSIE